MRTFIEKGTTFILNALLAHISNTGKIRHWNNKITEISILTKKGRK